MQAILKFMTRLHRLNDNYLKFSRKTNESVLINFFNAIYIKSVKGISMNRIYLSILLTITLLTLDVNVGHVEHNQSTIKQIVVDVTLSTVVTDELSFEDTDTDTDLFADLVALTHIVPRVLHSIKYPVASACTLFFSDNDIRGSPLSF
jgi:hypothetical protein